MKTEILAPAGGEESLFAAVRCGADAVYLGGKSLNARRAAQGFDNDQLAQAVEYCHVRGVKVYLTLNTLVFQRELPQLEAAVETACGVGVDAVIVQDLAAARLVRQRAPGLALHASTQMSVHDAAGARLLEELGFVRVVLARELSRGEIAAIRAATSLELECFIHGALCMCVSGQCYLSSMIGGRSGNRGTCAQPCRLPFSSRGRENVLSLKDLSLIPQAAELAALGVQGLKIEGRMKRPEYVAAAVTACREALAGGAPDYAALEAVFSRAGFTSGYYDGRPGTDMFGIRRKEDVQSAAPVLRSLGALYKDERQSVPVNMEFTLERGKFAGLQVTDGDGNRATATGPNPLEALTAPTTEEKAAASLGKTGGTPYTVGNIRVKIDQGLMIPASGLNALRREALEELTALRATLRPRPYQSQALPPVRPYDGSAVPALRARLARAEQLTAPLARRVERILLPAEEFPRLDRDMLLQYREKLLVELPGVVFHGGERLEKLLGEIRESGVAGAVVGGLGGIAMARGRGFALCGDYGLNITNSLALAEYEALGLTDATVSFELELAQLRGLGGTIPRGMLAYGHLPLMTTRNCPAGGCSGCKRDFPPVTDRLGNRFFVDCSWQVSHLYNHVPLFLADRLQELAGVDFLTLYFTREAPDRCAEIAALYETGGGFAGEKTRGLYYRKVL